MKVLLIEDDDVQARGIQRIFSGAGSRPVRVARAATLREARDALSSEPFDAILLDLSLPDSNGLDTFRDLRADAAGTPVVVVSALDDESIAQQAVAEGAQDYLVKGDFETRGLMRTVRYAIERQRAHSAALESEERFRLLVEAVEDYAIVMLDPGGNVISWNAGAERISGYPAEEVIGQHISMFYEEPDCAGGLPEAHLRCAVEQGVCHVEGWRRRRDGTRFYADATITALPGKRGSATPRGFSTVTRDVTAQKRTAEDLLAYQERLQRLAAELNRNEDEERRRLASILHDGISQALAAAQIKIDTLPQDSAERCGGALEEVRELIADAIDVTRRMTFDLSPPVLYQVGLPAALVALSEQVRRRHGIAAEVHCTGVWVPMMRPEARGLMYQAIRELVNNVIKHARATRVQILLFRRNPAPNGAPGTVRVRVIDDGVGFDPAEVTAAESRKEGFGLFNLRERIMHAQGWMDIRSQHGRGTEVEFEVPFDVAGNPAHASVAG